MRLPICLILGLLLFSAPAMAFQPHADCTFNKIDPLPKMDDCAHLERRVKSIKNNMASAQRAMDKLREAHGDAIDDLWEQGMQELFSEVTGIPTSAEGLFDCVLEVCGSRFAGALSTLTGLMDASSTFSGGIDARVWWGHWRDRLEDLKGDLEKAQDELHECLATRAQQATALDDAREYNRRGLPKYPADHPLCKPPEESDGGTEESGGGSQNDGMNSGGSGSGDGAHTTPDWDRMNDFNREETQRTLDWMDSEMDACAGLSSPAGCVKRTLNKRTLLQRHIDRSRNKAGSAAEEAHWQNMRSRLEDLRVRGNAIRKGGG